VIYKKMEKFYTSNLHENFEEKQKYLDEGWIETRLVFAAKNKKKAEEFFEEAIKNFDTKRHKLLKISFNEITQNPFVGAIIIDTLIYDIEELIKVVLNFAPVSVEIKKEIFNVSLSVLNQIFLDISDILKTYEYFSKLEIHSKDTNIEGHKIYANIILEFNDENRQIVEKRMNEAIDSIKRIVHVTSERKDDILEEEEENKKIYYGNVEMNIESDIFKFVDIITQFKPAFIEVNAPNNITMSRDEIYILLGKLLLMSQKHAERIVQSEKIADES